MLGSQFALAGTLLLFSGLLCLSFTPWAGEVLPDSLPMCSAVAPAHPSASSVAVGTPGSNWGPYGGRVAVVTASICHSLSTGTTRGTPQVPLHGGDPRTTNIKD